MEKDFYVTLHAVQERHWWYAARRDILASVIRDESARGLPDGLIYDLGCGVGANLPVLSRFGSVVGIDTSQDAVAFCHERGFANVRHADLNRLEGLEPESAKLVVLADVIEHLDDEVPCLTAARRLLKPNGMLLVTVPAFMFLWGPADELSHHRRRYTESSLRSVLQPLFDIERTTYFNTLLFGTVLAGRAVEKLFSRGGNDEAAIPPAAINWALGTIFRAEASLLRGRRLPFGVSILSVARKRVP